jgi:paraquat-inducible protein A
MRAECFRCSSTLIRQRSNSLERTAAFSLAALVLYVPANIYPILTMDYHGVHSESTVWDGCVTLFQSGQWVVAGIVFCASILIPMLKLLGLFFLVSTAKFRSTHLQRERTAVYKIIGRVGPWAMLDVFLLAIFVGLIKLQQLATVSAGPGIVPFAAVVTFTILAAASFDPRLIWDTQGEPL